MDVWKGSRSKRKAAWANKVQQLLLTGNREASEEVVLDAPRGVVVPKEDFNFLIC